MSMLSQVKSSLTKGRPRRVIIYGPHGIGKTTWAAGAEKPVLLPLEDGAGDLNLPSFPLCDTLTQALQSVSELAREEHDFRTLIVDSFDWLEQRIWEQVCRNGGKNSIEEFGYGAGYEAAATEFRLFLDGLDYLRNRRGMWIIAIAHARIVQFNNPMTDSYDRYEPKLHKHVNGKAQEWADEVLFAGYKVYTKTTEQGFNKERTRGVGSGDRILYTCEKPSHLAKNRLGLPEELPLSFAAYRQAVDEAYARIEQETPF